MLYAHSCELARLDSISESIEFGASIAQKATLILEAGGTSVTTVVDDIRRPNPDAKYRIIADGKDATPIGGEQGISPGLLWSVLNFSISW